MYSVLTALLIYYCISRMILVCMIYFFTVDEVGNPVPGTEIPTLDYMLHLLPLVGDMLFLAFIYGLVSGIARRL